MEAILDSSFILSCMKKNIDFIAQLEEMGFKAVVPREVMQELKDLRLKSSREDKMAIEIALSLIELRKVKKMSFGSGNVDEQLIKKGRSGVYIATLDKAIKREIPNKIVISSARKGIEVERS